jgi:hypothetical protein
MRIWWTLRLVLGAVLGAFTGIVAGLTFPGISAPTSMGSMANIAYFVLYVHGVAWMSLVFGLILPLLIPALSMRPRVAWLAAVALEIVSLAILFFWLDLGTVSSADRFAVATWKRCAAAGLVSMTVAYVTGVRNNRWLLQRARSS